MSKIKFLRVAELPVVPENDAIYFIPDGEGRTKGYLVDNEGAYRQIGADAGSVGEGVNGGVFITNVQPQSTIETVSEIVWANDNENDQLIGFKTTTENIIVNIKAISGHTHYKPIVNYIDHVGTPHIITLTPMTDAPLWTGQINITLHPEQTSIVIEHEDGATTEAVVTTEQKPEIITARFVDGEAYPIGQTELKENDQTKITITADRPIARVVLNGSYSNSAVKNLDKNIVSPAHTVVVTGLALDRGNTPNNRSFEVTIYDENGVGSLAYIPAGSTNGEHIVTLNNIAPTVNLTVLSYSNGYEALGGDAETAQIHSVVSNEGNAPYYQYSVSPKNELSIDDPEVFAAEKTVAYAAGTYNIDKDNLSLTVNRQENGSSTTANLVVKIAAVEPQITLTIDGIFGDKRLRSGGNDDSVAQNYSVRLSSNQQLLSIPKMSDLTLNKGVWVEANFILDGTNSWRRQMSVSDNHDKGAATFPSIYAINLAGKEVTEVVDGLDARKYVLSGFVSRTLSLPPSLSTPQVSANVETFNWNNVRMVWSYKSMDDNPSDPITEPPKTNGWKVASSNSKPTIIEILDLASYDSISGQTTTITIEEIV